MGDDLIDLHVVDAALALVAHVLADDVGDFRHRLAGGEFRGEFVIERGQHGLLEFVELHGKHHLAVLQIGHREVLRQGERDLARVAGIHARQLGGESGQEGFFIEAHPETLAAGEITGGLAEKFLGRLAIDGG